MEHIPVEHVSNIFSDAAICLSFHSQVLLLHSLLQEQVKRAQKFLRLRYCYFRTLDEIIVITVHGFSFSTRDSEEDSSFRKIPNWWRKIGFPAAKQKYPSQEKSNILQHIMTLLSQNMTHLRRGILLRKRFVLQVRFINLSIFIIMYYYLLKFFLVFFLFVCLFCHYG